MIPGAIKWCNICNTRPATGMLSMMEKSTKHVMAYDCCTHCAVAISSGKVDWIENGLES